MIDPRRLRLLQAVAVHGTVSAAGRALYLSASAVSQQLSALEAEVGHPLFERRGRRIVMTPTGRALTRHAGRMAALLEEAEAEVAATAVGDSGDVNVAAFSSAITEIVAPMTMTLPVTSPDVRIHVKEAEGPLALRLLTEGRVDIAVAVPHDGRSFFETEGLRRDQLYSEPFDALLPADHSLADSVSVDLSDLSRERWITPWDDNPIHDLVFLACDEAGFRPFVSAVSNDYRATSALVRAGAGVALVPRSALNGSSGAGVRLVPIRGGRPRRTAYVYVRVGSERHPLLNLVLGALHDQVRQVELSERPQV